MLCMSREEQILKIVKENSKNLPCFEDGRIDYTKAIFAPVVIVFIQYNDKILLLRRSDKVLEYKNKWSTVAGFLDELKPITEKVRQELKEELNITDNDIESIHIGDPYEFDDEGIKRIWLRCPALVVLNKKVNIDLDWEHSEYAWISKEEIVGFDIVPDTERTLNQAFK